MIMASLRLDQTKNKHHSLMSLFVASRAWAGTFRDAHLQRTPYSATTRKTLSEILSINSVLARAF